MEFRLHIILLIACLAVLSLPCHANPLQKQSSAAESPEHWNTLAKKDIKIATDIAKRINKNRAKNAMLFLGDGMGITSVTAGRILKGQLVGKRGEEETLEFETFSSIALTKTYNTDRQTPDSAGTATAFLCGVKAKSGTMGVNEFVVTQNCATQGKENHVYSFLTEAQQLGKSVGIVTTTRITHATPGAAYAHTAWRGWEDDTARNSGVPNVADRSICPDIAEQLISNAINYTVIFGGGRRQFLPNNVPTINPINGASVYGSRSDSVNLIERWKQQQSAFGRNAKYLETRKDLLDAPIDADTYLGLFAIDNLRYDLDNSDQKEPTLEEMTRKAINILKQNSKGFALLVEGGRIDHGHHENRAKKALYDLIAFDKAIKTAGEMTSADDTLTVVTADHSHVFSIGGWGSRGQPVFGKVKFPSLIGNVLAHDNLPYTPLYYGDGPSARIDGKRPNITDVDTESADYQQQALVKFSSESHGAEDVPVYAKGPGSYLFHSTHEQSYVAHVIKYSLCVGSYAMERHCFVICCGSASWPSISLIIGLLWFRVFVI